MKSLSCHQVVEYGELAYAGRTSCRCLYCAIRRVVFSNCHHPRCADCVTTWHIGHDVDECMRAPYRRRNSVQSARLKRTYTGIANAGSLNGDSRLRWGWWRSKPVDRRRSKQVLRAHWREVIIVECGKLFPNDADKRRDGWCNLISSTRQKIKYTTLRPYSPYCNIYGVIDFVLNRRYAPSVARHGDTTSLGSTLCTTALIQHTPV